MEVTSTRARAWKKLALAGGGLMLGVLLAEGLVRAFVPVRNVGPSFTVYDPVHGRRLKTSFACSRIAPEFTMRFTTNSLGFRGPEPDRFPQRAILFLGDSFTMGYGVNDGEEYPRLVGSSLARQLGDRQIPVVNAAIGDNGTGRWIAFLRNDAPRFEPRCVVLQVCGNDFADNVREQLFRLDEQDRLVESRVPPRPGLKRIAQCVVEAVPGLAYSRLVSLFRQITVSPLPGAPVGVPEAPKGTTDAAVAPGDRLTYRLIEEVIAICREQGWPLLALVVAVEGPRLASLQEAFGQHHVPCIVLPSRSERPDLYYAVDGHWNATGHAYVAEVTVRQLLANVPL